MKLVAATRSTPLALYQTQKVIEHLEGLVHEVELLHITTDIDKKINTPLSEVGKSAFTGALEKALIDRKADFAVHSLKDLGVHQPGTLGCALFLKRSFPEDVFLSHQYPTPMDAPKGTIVGTSSLRRYWQLKHKYPHLNIKPIRGSVGRRISRLGVDYDAIILAKAGIDRLGLSTNYQMTLPLSECVPSPGQGVIVAQMSEEHELFNQVKSLSHSATAMAVNLERKIVKDLGGHCKVPLGVYVDYHNDQWRVLVNLSYDKESIFLHQCHKNMDTLYDLIHQDLSKYDIKGKITELIQDMN